MTNGIIAEAGVNASVYSKSVINEVAKPSMPDRMKKVINLLGAFFRRCASNCLVTIAKIAMAAHNPPAIKKMNDSKGLVSLSPTEIYTNAVNAYETALANKEK